MTLTKSYCDICGREMKDEEGNLKVKVKIRRWAPVHMGVAPYWKKCDVCNDCRREISRKVCEEDAACSS